MSLLAFVVDAVLGEVSSVHGRHVRLHGEYSETPPL